MEQARTTTLADLLVTADSLAVHKMLQDERVKQDGRPVADLDVIGPQRYHTTGPLGDSSGWGGAGALAPSGHFAVPTAIRRRLVDHQANPYRTTEPPHMGLLPEISHGYLCLGPSLFLWRFDAGAAAAEAIVEFSEVDADITAIALVPPRPPPEGNFGASVDWLMVVATRDEILLVAVEQFTQGTFTVRLTPTDFAIPTDNQDVTRGAIAGTASGRIFLGSSQGGLSEVSYSANEGWKEALGLRRSVRRVECGRAPLAFLVPGFLKQALSYGVPLVTIQSDNQRHLLYTLNAKGFIELFYLGVSGKEEMSLIDRRAIFNLAESSVADTRRYFQAAGVNEGHCLVELEVVPLHESREVHAVAVSNYGFRFYLSTSPPSSSSMMAMGPNTGGASSVPYFQPPTGLYLRSVRAPPGVPAFNAVVPTRSDAELMQAGQALGGSSALQQLPSSSSSSGLALTGGTSSSSSGAAAAAAASDPNYDAVTPEDLERAKKAAAGSSTGSCYCSLPGVAATTVYYKEKTLVMATSATGRPGAPNPDNHLQRLYALTEDVCRRPGSGGAAEEALSLVANSGSDLFPGAITEIAEIRQNLKHSSLYSLALASKVPENHALKKRANTTEAGRYASLLLQTAASKPSSSSSAALPNWLAHSRAVPMHPSIAAMWAPKRHLLALRGDPSSGGGTRADVGITALSLERPFDTLHALLLNNNIGGSFAPDSPLRQLFNRLGHVEGCALTCAVACALPSDLAHPAPAGAIASSSSRALTFGGTLPRESSSSHPMLAASSSSTLHSGAGGALGSSGLGLMGANEAEAAAAVLSNKVLSEAASGGSGGGGASSSTSSGLSPSVDGLYVFLGRLLRPLWHTPLVCLPVAGGGAPNTVDSSKRQRVAEPQPLPPPPRSLPPTVVPLAEIDRLRRVLESLIQLMGRVYGSDLSAACSDLQSAMAASSQSLHVPDYLNALQAPSTQVVPKSSGASGAMKKDQSSALGAYALAHATAQALALVQILGALHRDHAEVEVGWGAHLNGITLGQLACDRSTRKALSTALNDHDGTSKSIALVKFKASPGSAELRNLFHRDLAENCGFFFTPSVQLGKQALQHVQDAKAYARHRNHVEASAAIDRALETYRAASSHWRSDEDVLGSRSKLKVAAEALRSLKCPQGVVELCLRTSRHFDDQQASLTSSVGRELTATPFAGGGGGGASGIAERDVWLSTLHRDAPLADSNTRKEITESCYMTAVGEIHALLDESQVYPDARNAMPLPERQRKADECIARALRVAAEGGGFASSSSSLSATGFQDMLFGMLRDEGHKQRLTSIQSPHVEVYLTKQGDEELLLNHLHQSGRYAQAIERAHAFATSQEVLSSQALPPGQHRPLDERPSIGFSLPHGVLTRLQCLDLALRSARAAMESQQQLQGGGAMGASSGSFDATMSELLEQKQRAIWQQNLLSKLELRQDPGDWVTAHHGSGGGFDSRRDWLPTQEQLHALRFQLIDDPSILFNDFAFKLNMWDDCLIMLRDSGVNDQRHIHALWQQIVLQCLPRRAMACPPPRGAERLELVRDYLTYGCVAGLATPLEPDVLRIAPQECFEEGAWVQELAHVIGRTITQLWHGGSAAGKFVVPLRTFLVPKLEEATAHVLYAKDWHQPQVPEMWVVDTLLEARVSWDELYGAYAALVKPSTAGFTSLHYLRSFVGLVEKWALHCERASSTGMGGGSGPTSAAAELSLFKTVCRTPGNALHDLLTHIRSNATSIFAEGNAVEKKEDLMQRVDALLRRPFIHHMLSA